MKRNRKVAGFIILLLLLLLSSCNNELAKPKIETEVTVRTITKREYSEVGTFTLENSTMNDFKKLIFNFKMTYSKDIKSFNINIPEGLIWRSNINSIDRRERYLFGSEVKDNQSDQRLVNYHKEFVFYSKGLSNEQIRKAFDTTIIRVTYETINGQSYTIEHYASNLIQFSGENNK